MEYYELILNFLKSPFGGSLVSFFFGAVGQEFSYKGFALNKATRPKVDQFLSELVGYIVTIAVAAFLYLVISNDWEMLIYNLALAMAFHLAYAKWLNPKLKNMGKAKAGQS